MVTFLKKKVLMHKCIKASKTFQHNQLGSVGSTAVIASCRYLSLTEPVKLLNGFPGELFIRRASFLKYTLDLSVSDTEL